MPTSGPTTVPPAPGPSASLTTVPSHVSKPDPPVKQIAICAIQSPGSAVTAAAPQTRAPVSSGQFIGSASAVTSLMMINHRFATDGRPAVLLQPRSGGGQPVVVTTSNASTPTRYQIQIPQHQTIRTIVPAVSPAPRHNSIQLMNLSVSNPTPGAVHHAKAGTGSRPFGTFPLESTVGLVLQNSSDQTVRPIRLQTAAGQTVTAKTITAAARPSQPKVINLTTAGNNVTVAQGRQNILLGATTGSTGKPAILNLNKSGSAVIINPNSAVQLNQLNSSATGNFNSHHHSNQAKAALIPVNSAVMTIAAGQLPRHHPIGTGSAVTFPASQRIITCSQQQLPQPQQQQQPPHIVSISGSGSSLKNSVLTTTASPIKQQIPVPTPASPRPSILNRKRVVSEVRPLLTPTKCKQEPVKLADVTDEENLTVTDRLVPVTGQDQQPATPRKKPRKQLLEPFDLSANNLKLLNCEQQNDNRLVEEQYEQDEDLDPDRDPDDQDDQDLDQEETDDASQEEMDCEEDEDEDDEEVESFSMVSPLSGRKPRISLFPFHPPNCNWKALQHHFLRYTDVKPKAEKKLTLSELSNEGLQKKNGWKIHHLATQMEDMSDNESELLQRLNQCLHSFRQCISDLPLMRESLTPDCPFQVSLGDKLTDLIRGNIQRSTLFQEQMTESKQLLIKLTNDHRERVGKLTKKNINKRTCISK